MKQLLLIVGDDYWGRVAANAFADRHGASVAKNVSVSSSRMMKLIARGSLPLSALAKMALAEFRRPRVNVSVPFEVADNQDILTLATKLGFDTVVLFRAGLIVSSKVLEATEVLNVHCADLASYGGLAAIDRALRNRAFLQHATLHRVTTRIDEGEVLDTEPYRLDPAATYGANEDLAYSAGIRLLTRTIDRLLNDSVEQTKGRFF